MSPTIGTNIPSLNIAIPISRQGQQPPSKDAPPTTEQTTTQQHVLKKTQALLHRLADGTITHAKKHSMEMVIPTSITKKEKKNLESCLTAAKNAWTGLNTSSGQAAIDTINNKNTKKVEALYKERDKLLNRKLNIETVGNTENKETKKLLQKVNKELVKINKELVKINSKVENTSPIQEAIKTQYALRASLLQCAQSLPKSPDPMKPTSEQQQIQQQITDCDRKISELMNLSGSLTERLLKDEAIPEAIKKQSITETLNAMRLDMHGTPALLQKSLSALLAKIETLETKKDSMAPEAFTQEITNLQTLIKSTKESIGDGSFVITDLEVMIFDVNPDVLPVTQHERLTVNVDPAVTEAVNNVLDSAALRLKDLQDTDPLQKYRDMLQDIQKAYNLSSTAEAWTKLEAQVKDIPHEKKFLEALKDTKILEPITGLSKEELKTRVNATITLLKQPVETSRGGIDFRHGLLLTMVRPSMPSGSIPAKLHEVLLGELQKFSAAIDREGRDGEMLTQVLLDPVHVQTLLQAKIRGFSSDSPIALHATPKNLVSSEQLGSGAVNSVIECVYKSEVTGEEVTYIFKGEHEGRRGLNAASVVNNTVISSKASIGGLNLVANEVATLFGCGGVLAQSSLGILNEQFGIFMEKAPGYPASKRENKADFVKALAGLTPPEKQKIALNNLLRELAKLEWADGIAGQHDRHDDNYFFHFDEKTLAVKITGIDNDCCFGSQAVGLAKIDKIDCSSEEIYKSPFRHLGSWQTSKPLFITPEIQKQLSDMTEDNYRTFLAKSQLEPEAIEAAVSRLKDAQAYAKTCPVLGADPDINIQAFIELSENAWPEPELVGENKKLPPRGFALIYRDFHALQPLLKRLSA